MVRTIGRIGNELPCSLTTVSVATQSRAESAILDATERLPRERPLPQLNVADLIEEAGVSRPSFYAYFASKTAVIAECLREVMDQVMVAVRPFHQQSGGDAEAAIRVSLQQWVEVCKTHGALLRTVSEAKPRPPLNIWLDIGTEEGYAAVPDARHLRDALIADGWTLNQDLSYFEAQGAHHDEEAWSVRVEPFLKFLFPPHKGS